MKMEKVSAMVRFWFGMACFLCSRAGSRGAHRLFSRSSGRVGTNQGVGGRHSQTYDVTMDIRKTGVYAARHSARWFDPSFYDVMELWVDGTNFIPKAWIREPVERVSW